MELAADIANYMRRMCLSVIRLHNSNDYESLISSQAHNFHDIISPLPMKHDASASAIHDEIIVSNLPSVFVCPVETQSPELTPRIPKKTQSELDRSGQTSSDEYPLRRFSFKDSLHSDVDVDYKDAKQTTLFLDVSTSFRNTL
jgi:hypothetical protein